ncbi:hypothetical protein Ae201684P_005061 [Aphanomyces euteiches]|nr:hypothetical protein Ae201684P_005061 [Aphanomyces euteiches]
MAKLSLRFILDHSDAICDFLGCDNVANENGQCLDHTTHRYCIRQGCERLAVSRGVCIRRSPLYDCQLSKWS